MSKKDRRKKIQEQITNISNLGYIPADEVQLNIDIVYNSILDEICSVVPINSYRQVISTLRLTYDNKQKSQINNKDAVNTNLMTAAGAVMPLDDNGYPTNKVSFEIITNSEQEGIIGNYKNIIPGTLTISNVSGDIIAHDNGLGELMTSSGKPAGTVDYVTAWIKPDGITEGKITYKFDLSNIETTRNFVKFKKNSVETFADQFQLDLDTAVVLNDFKGLNIKDNIDKILPEVLAQQIDNFVIKKMVDQLSISSNVGSFDATQDYTPIDVDKVISKQMLNFTNSTGVVPNVILCDPEAMSVLRIAKNFVPLAMLHIDNEFSANINYSGTPRFAGYFDTCKVFMFTNTDVDSGNIILTYKGPSDAQAAVVYTPFIPITLRKVIGMEGNGMIQTNTAYSIGGSTVINPELIQGIKIKLK